jgi:hypothetical protein
MTWSRAISWLVIACSVWLLAPLTVPLFTGKVFVYNDLSWFHLPIRHIYQQALQNGDTVLWTPSLFAGYYLHGEGQTGLFHPWHQLIYRALPLGPAFNLELIATYPFAFGGMFWLLRRLRCSHPAALFGAMLFAFSGFNLLHHHHLNLVVVVAHMPWLLAAADVVITEPERRAQVFGVATMALVLGSAFLLGFPQAVWWNLLSLSAFLLLRVIETGRWRRLLACAAGVVLGIALGGIQLLPTAEMASQSTRMNGSGEFAMTYSLHPLNLFQLWSPRFFESGAFSTLDYMWFHEFGIYSGAIMIASLLWVWIRRDALRERRALIIGTTLFATVMLIMALGLYGGLAIALTHVPGLQSLRAPTRYIMHVQFALAILAAIALDDLLAINEERRPAATGLMPVLWIPPALGVLTTLLLNSGALGYGESTLAPMTHAAEGVGFVVLVTAVLFLAGRRVVWALPAVVALTAFDLRMWALPLIHDEPAKRVATITQAIEPAPQNPAEAYAAGPLNGPYKLNVAALQGYRITNAYVGLFPSTYYPLTSKESLELSGTRWTIAEDGIRTPFDGGVSRVRLLDEHASSADGVARMVTDRPGFLVARVESSGRRLVAFTERFHDGWTATADGVPMRVVRVDADFLGCIVEPGVHRIELRFKPRSFVYGSYVSLAGLVLLTAVILVARRQEGTGGVS